MQKSGRAFAKHVADRATLVDQLARRGALELYRHHSTELDKLRQIYPTIGRATFEVSPDVSEKTVGRSENGHASHENITRPQKRRRLSKATRKKMSLAQQARWVKKKRVEKPAKAAK